MYGLHLYKLTKSIGLVNKSYLIYRIIVNKN